MTNVLTTRALAKSYGKIKAVKGLDLKVPRGAVYGILGPNGSGKSTTLSIVLGILSADSGNFSWFGKPPSNESRKRIGALLEGPNFYPYLSAKKNLELVCRIKEVPFKQIEPALEMVGLLARKDSAFKTFSTGMKARLAIAASILSDPEVLVLDEPTNGLDPQGIADIRMLIKQIAAQDKTILLASHILDEVEKVCDHVAVIKNGVLLAQGHVREILADTHQIELRAADMHRLQAALELYPHKASINIDDDTLVLGVSEEPDGAAVSKFLSEHEVWVHHMVVRKKRLEETFLELTAQQPD